MGVYCDSEVILQRIVPFMLLSTEDTVASVRAISVMLLCSMLSYVDNFLPHEKSIFTKIIFPSLNTISRDSETVVRVAFVECIGRFAELSKHFLEKSRSFQMKKLDEHKPSSYQDATGGESGALNDAGNATYDDNVDLEKKVTAIKEFYSTELMELQSTVTRWVTSVLLDQSGTLDSSHSALYKKILLTDITRLCGFFGTELTLDVLLSQLLTFLNEQNWELRLSFCDALPGVCSFLGETFTSNFIYPCIENALVDVEVMVVGKALDAVSSIIQLKLFNGQLIEKTLELFSCLVVHPVKAVRCSAVEMILAAHNVLGATTTYALIRPFVLPFLEYDIFASGDTLTKEGLEKALQSPVTAKGYRVALDEKRNELSPGSALSTVSIYPSKHTVRIDPSMKSDSTPNLVSLSTANVSSVVVDSGNEPPLPRENSSSSMPPVPSSDRLSSLDKSQLTDEGAEEERRKLDAMAKYIEQAAYEMNTKTLQWRNFSQSVNHKDLSRSSYQEMMDAKSLSTLKNNSRILDVPSSGLIPESSVHWLRIPHQKLSVSIGIYEELRRMANDFVRLAEDPILINKIYGIRQRAVTNTPSTAYGENDGGTSEGQVNSDVNPSHLSTNRPMSMAMVQGISKARTITSGKSFDMSTPTRSISTTPNLTPAQELLSIAGSPVAEAPRTTDINNSVFVANALAELSGTDVILRQIRGLNVPPLPRNLGALKQPDGRNYSSYTEPLDMSGVIDPQSRASWRPKDATQLASLSEHSQAVTRLSVAQNQSFFVSASADKTARVWQISGLENNAYPRSALTYAMHTGRLTDVTTIENSHSVATACENGSIHVWRVDVARRSMPVLSSPAGQMASSSSITSPGGPSRSSLSVSGMSEIKNLSSSDGGVVCLQHFNGDSASLLTYCTTSGGIRSWDLRSSREPFQYRLPCELGYPTAMTLAPDKNWMCVGTSKGCVALWDIRYNVMCKLWQHSSASTINRLASCKTISSSLGSRANAGDYPEGAYLFLAAGRGEAAVWGLPEGGECIRCYRTVPAPPVDSARVPTYHAIESLPVLNEIPLMSRHSRYDAVGGMLKRGNLAPEPSVRSVIGRISSTGSSYIITAGSDRYIRFWDFSNSANCFTVSGLDSAQPRHQYATPDLPEFRRKLFLCFDTAVPTAEQTLQTHVPSRENRGLVTPPVGFKVGFKVPHCFMISSIFFLV